jgi:hypothetical protein
MKLLKITSTADGLHFFCYIVVEILNLKAPMRLMQKNNIFSEQNVMPLTNALKSIAYTDIILFLTIIKMDIYQHKSLGKSATDFYLNIQKPERGVHCY